MMTSVGSGNILHVKVKQNPHNSVTDNSINDKKLSCEDKSINIHHKLSVPRPKIIPPKDINTQRTVDLPTLIDLSVGLSDINLPESLGMEHLPIELEISQKSLRKLQDLRVFSKEAFQHLKSLRGTEKHEDRVTLRIDTKTRDNIDRLIKNSIDYERYIRKSNNNNKNRIHSNKNQRKNNNNNNEKYNTKKTKNTYVKNIYNIADEKTNKLKILFRLHQIKHQMIITLKYQKDEIIELGTKPAFTREEADIYAKSDSISFLEKHRDVKEIIVNGQPGMFSYYRIPAEEIEKIDLMIDEEIDKISKFPGIGKYLPKYIIKNTHENKNSSKVEQIENKMLLNIENRFSSLLHSTELLKNGELNTEEEEFVYGGIINRDIKENILAIAESGNYKYMKEKNQSTGIMEEEYISFNLIGIEKIKQDAKNTIDQIRREGILLRNTETRKVLEMLEENLYMGIFLSDFRITEKRINNIVEMKIDKTVDKLPKNNELRREIDQFKKKYLHKQYDQDRYVFRIPATKMYKMVLNINKYQNKVNEKLHQYQNI